MEEKRTVIKTGTAKKKIWDIEWNNQTFKYEITHFKTRQIQLRQNVLSLGKYIQVLGKKRFMMTEQYDLDKYDRVYAAYDDRACPTKFVLHSTSTGKKGILYAETSNSMYEWIKCINQQQSKHDWKCQFCTFLNKHNRSDICEMCGNSNEIERKNRSHGDDSKNNFNDVYEQLINMGFSDEISNKASNIYTSSIIKALKIANKMRLDLNVEIKKDDNKINDIHCIKIPIEMTGLNNCIEFEEFTLKIKYCDETLIKDVVNKSVEIPESLYYPRTFRIFLIKKDSFIGKLICSEDNGYEQLLNTKITKYKIQNIVSKGLSIQIENRFIHKIRENEITCKHMLQNNTTNPNACPIYLSMKKYSAFTEDSLNHLNEYVHFYDECNDKTKCKYGQKCFAFVRLENGGNNLADQCHMKLYRHPPRRRTIRLEENMKMFMINKKYTDNHYVYVPTPQDGVWYYNNKDGYLNALIFEVIYNKYKADLCLTAEDLEQEHLSILQIVDEKMKAKRHQIMGNPLTRGQMLALLLYTGCECNFDLCASQRKRDYTKWKWF
eukprot:547575_1